MCFFLLSEPDLLRSLLPCALNDLTSDHGERGGGGGGRRKRSFSGQKKSLDCMCVAVCLFLRRSSSPADSPRRVVTEARGEQKRDTVYLSSRPHSLLLTGVSYWYIQAHLLYAYLT